MTIVHLIKVVLQKVRWVNYGTLDKESSIKYKTSNRRLSNVNTKKVENNYNVWRE